MKRKMSLLGIVCTVLFVVTCINPESNPDINPDATGIVADEYEPDDSRSTAKLIYPDSSSQSRTLKMGETDWVRLEALSGKSYEIITDGKIDTKLEVYSATGSEPVVGGDDSPGDINAVVTLNATSDGVYYIAVFGHDDSTLGSYELRVVSSIGPDAFEPDSLPNPARSITAGATQKRSLTEGDVDWVICRLAADDTVLLTAEGTCPIALTLYDRDTVTELESPSAGDSMTQISHHAEKAGNYFLKVTADDPDDTGSYELTMQSSSSGSLIAADDFEDDDTRSSAELVPGNSFIQQRTLTFNDTDWVCLPVVEGRQYNVTFTNTSFLKATMLSNDGMELQGPASSLYLNSSADDTVYIQIYSTDSIAFRYSLTITVLLQPNIADDYEDDNSKELAKENCVPVDSFIQDRTLTVKNSVSDTDWVAFPVVAAKQYLFKVTTSSSTTLYMYLYDNTSSSYIRNTSGSSPSISYTPPVSDTMYLRIYRPSSSTGVAYTLSVRGELKNDSFEPDSSRSTARSITTTSQSRILLPDDTDWVAYTAAADDSIAIVTTGATDTKIALFSSSGSTPIEENDDIDDDNTNAMISWKSASGGQFYIRVTGKTSSTSGSYVLQVLSVLNGTLTAADSFEVDNTKDEARIIPDTIVSGEVHSLTLNDTDWVAFPVLAGGQYTVSVSSSSNYLNVHAYTSSDSLFYSRTSATSASIPYTAKKNDTLYYRVTSASVVQRYTVSMSRIAPPPHDEYENDNTKEAARILFDTIVSSEVHSMPLYDTDWVAFPALAGGQYTVSVSSSSSALSVYAYTSKDSLFTSRTNYTSTSITRISPIDDTLYYRITSNYSLQRYTVSMSMIAPPSPDQYEDDDTKDEARIVLDTILSGEVHSLPLTDTDWVAFPVLAGGQYTVSVSSSSAALSVYAFTSGDSLFASRAIYTSTSITFTAKKNDTLYYRITSAYSLQRYTVSMSRIAPPSPDQYEDDDTKDEARIVLDTILSGEVHSLPLTDTDWVAFPAKAGGQYTVSVASSSSSLNVYAYTSKDSLFASRTSYTSTSISRVSPTDDTLYYRITSAYSLQRYTISMSRIVPPDPDMYEPDNNRTQVQPIMLDSLQTHTLTMYDTDWVQIELDSGSTYRVATSASFYHYVFLYLGSVIYNNSYGSSVTLTVAPDSTATLFVQVRNYSTSVSYTGPYTIRVTQLVAAPPEDI